MMSCCRLMNRFRLTIHCRFLPVNCRPDYRFPLVYFRPDYPLLPDCRSLPDYHSLPDCRSLPDYRSRPDYRSLPDYLLLPDYRSRPVYRRLFSNLPLSTHLPWA